MNGCNRAFSVNLTNMPKLIPKYITRKIHVCSNLFANYVEAENVISVKYSFASEILILHDLFQPIFHWI